MSPTRLVIALAGAALLVSIALVGVLAVLEKPTPDFLQNVGIGALGLLGGILSNPRPAGEEAPPAEEVGDEAQ